MKKKFFLTFLSVACFLAASYAQRFQATTGTTLEDEKWAVIEDPAINSYVAIGNSSNIDNFSRIWISSYNAAGMVTTSAIATNGRRIIARDISLAPKDSATGKTTYYVTGWTVSSAGVALLNQMFVGRINLAGTFLWYSENPSGTSTGGTNKEGVAVVTAPNGDVVAMGISSMPLTGNIPAGQRIIMARFNRNGGPVWSNVYNQTGNWMPREIAIGAPSTNCAVSPLGLPGEFIVTGEVSIPTSSGGPGRPGTFAALYNGAGTECWRGLYPANGSFTTTADAGYDVVLNTSTGNYNIVGVAQLGSVRASANSTPYMVEVSRTGALIKSNIYFKTPNLAPMGLYPRTCALSTASTGASGKLVFAGPDFGLNKTFMGSVPAIGTAGTFVDFGGLATANSVAQPFYLNDAQPEGILATTISTKPGYLISTNALPAGAFGGGDGHLIKTDLAFQTPNDCKSVSIDNFPFQVSGSAVVTSTVIQQSGWTTMQVGNTQLPVQQRFCRDTCTVASSFTFTQSGSTVNFTGTATGNATVSYTWNFGDGTTSSLLSPTHTYAGSGVYNVCLLVYNVNSAGDSCFIEYCKSITVVKCDVVAAFTYTVACKYKVTFTNTSTGTPTLTYKWIFDDGTTSTTKNPIKIFTTCGRHVTKLITCNTFCCDTTSVVVNIPCCEVKSDFCLRDSGLYVKLIYSSTMNLPTTTYTVFVDGVLTPWTANTSKLLASGLHKICLKARRVSCPGDTCCATCCKTINVSPNCTLVADFWSQVQTTTGNVLFTNKTLPAGFTSVWNFGDGSPTVTTASPSHVYAPGTYTVCLSATLVNGKDTCFSRICKRIVVDSACKALAKFKTTYCLNAPLSIEFGNYSSGATSYLWNFGDGSTSAVANPTHLYLNAGTYTACLYAFSGDNCVSKVCHKIVATLPSCKTNCDSILPGNREIADGEIIENIPEGQINSEDKSKSKVASTEPAKHEERLSLFPNPASQKMQVVYEAATRNNAEVVVVNALGNVVYKKIVSFAEGQNQFSIPVQTFANGNYFLKVSTAGNIKSTLFSVKN